MSDIADHLSGDTTLFRGGTSWRSTPHRLGQYEIRRVINAGGMGTVYEAVQHHPRRIVALKVMQPGLGSGSAWRRFQNESQILARLHHPGIAQVYEAGTHDEGGASIPYFAMEYVPGATTITDYARSHRLDTRQKLALFSQVCAAVHHGHQKGIIHRDLKPANILVDSSGQLKIIDFGVARATDADLAVTTLQTHAGDLVGTVQYMSPEQVAGDARDIDPRSDVYSLGVVLYELLAGELPHDLKGQTLTEALRIIREQPPRMLSKLDPALRGDIESIVHAALQKDRTLRFQTADEFRQNIERYLNDEPLSIRRASLGYVARTHARSFVRRHRITAMLLAAVLAALVAEFIGVPLVYRWTPANRWYAQALGAPANGSIDQYRHVRVVRITESCLDEVDELAAQFGLDGVTTANRPSHRRLYGRFMERLASAGVRSVIWDSTFVAESEFDADVVNGVEALAAAGCDVVVVVRPWPLNGGRPALSSNLVRHVRAGTPSGQFNDVHWMLDLAVQRGNGDPVPSFALLAVAASLHQGSECGLLLNPLRNSMTAKFYVYPDPLQPTFRQQLDDVLNLELTSIESLPASAGEPETGLKPGDMIAYFRMTPPSDKVIAASSVDFAPLMRMSDHELRELVSDAVVVIGKISADDLHMTPDGRMIPGVYAQAAGIEAILTGGRAVKIERVTASWTAIAILALLGAVIAGLSLRRPVMRLATLATLAGAVVIFSALIYHRWLYLLNPTVPLIALVLAFGIGTCFLRLVQRDTRARISP